MYVCMYVLHCIYIFVFSYEYSPLFSYLMLFDESSTSIRPTIHPSKSVLRTTPELIRVGQWPACPPSVAPRYWTQVWRMRDASYPLGHTSHLFHVSAKASAGWFRIYFWNSCRGMVVEPSVQGKGIGTRALQLALAESDAAGHPVLLKTNEERSLVICHNFL